MTEPKQKQRSSPWQFSLLSLLLLATLAAVWVANWRIKASIAELQAELPALQNYARELVIEDRQNFSIVAPHPVWMDDYRWFVYVPELRTGSAMLALQLAEIEGSGAGFGKPVRRVPLPAGEHELQLQYDKGDQGWTIQLLMDGQQVLEETRPIEWNSSRGSQGGNLISRLNHDPRPPFSLFHRRFNVIRPNGSITAPPDPSNGIHLWIVVE